MYMFEKWVDSHMDQQLEDIKNLIRIPSVSRGTPEDGKPLGKDVYDALEYAIALANRLGFEKTQNLDGYCATVDYGEGDELMMIQCHLDVVPAGSGWNSDPFDPVIHDGRLYGRGVVDDKGAAVSVLYAMAAIKDAGLSTKRRIRLFLGGDEECGWDCVNRYHRTEPDADIGFTPDADYPLVNSEMGICQSRYVRSVSGSSIRINCGTAANVVPGEASATLSFKPVPCKVPEGYSAEFTDNEIRIKGSGGHAACNYLAKNALLCLLDVLSNQPLSGDDLMIVSGLHAMLEYDCHGEGLGIDTTDESGRLTLAADILKWDDSRIEFTMDCRHPFSISATEVLQRLDANMATIGFSREYEKISDGIYSPADSELVSTLLGIYEKHIGHKSEPLSIGGGTYARGFSNTVGFGIEPEGEVSECHMPNESMSLDNIRFNTIVFAEAIKALACK